MKELRFLRCHQCGNIITKLQVSGSRALCCDEVIAVYEYCNLHGLYKTMVKA